MYCSTDDREFRQQEWPTVTKTSLENVNVPKRVFFTIIASGGHFHFADKPG